MLRCREGTEAVFHGYNLQLLTFIGLVLSVHFSFCADKNRSDRKGETNPQDSPEVSGESPRVSGKSSTTVPTIELLAQNLVHFVIVGSMRCCCFLGSVPYMSCQLLAEKDSQSEGCRRSGEESSEFEGFSQQDIDGKNRPGRR